METSSSPLIDYGPIMELLDFDLLLTTFLGKKDLSKVQEYLQVGKHGGVRERLTVR